MTYGVILFLTLYTMLFSSRYPVYCGLEMDTTGKWAFDSKVTPGRTRQSKRTDAQLVCGKTDGT